MANDDRPWQVGDEPERWAGYLDPQTGMLRTLSAKPIKTADELRDFEDSRVHSRVYEVKTNPIQGDFGIDHLRAIHRQLFQDVYPWAGEIRTVGIQKGGQGFLPAEHVGLVVNGAARLMRADGMLKPGMDNTRWSGLLAERFNDVNEAHPFREGNGRTQRLYFDQVAEAGGKMIHWNVLTKEQNIAVSHAARDGDLAPLREALGVMVTDRMDPLAMQRAKQAAEAMRASSAPRNKQIRARDAGAGERAYYGRAGAIGPQQNGYER